MSTTMNRMKTLRSSDGDAFVVEEAVALKSQTIKYMIEDDFTDADEIPLPNVTSKTLAMVIEYCKNHVADQNYTNKDTGNAAVGYDLKKWDEEFVKGFDHATLFDVMLAATYLEIKGLLYLTCQAVADVIKGKSMEEIRKVFNIENSFASHEFEAIVGGNQSETFLRLASYLSNPYEFFHAHPPTSGFVVEYYDQTLPIVEGSVESLTANRESTERKRKMVSAERKQEIWNMLCLRLCQR